MVGFTDDGTVTVSVAVLEPIRVLLEYVSAVMIIEALVAFGMLLAKVSGGVHEAEVV